MFHRHYFDFTRNIDAAGRLAEASAIRTRRVPIAEMGRRLFHETKRNQTMGLFTKDIRTMNDLFVHELQDIYYAEQQLVKALPKMAEKASDQTLKQGFLTHLEETKGHVKRLEQVFEMHGAQVKAVTCPAIDGIIKEA